ncbi:MAG: glutaredoxin family protein [Deltaproteobacteria bacterium]|nr:glutaredoxin family protein [Deltaproteobacteria bacterium]
MTLYTRLGCCLCEEMKEVVRRVAGKLALEMEEIDVDSEPELAERHGNEVPVLFIDGRKAFKVRVTIRELERKLLG